MQLTDLQTDTRYLISPQLTATDYPNTDLNRNINRWYRRTLGWVFAAMGKWSATEEFAYTDSVIGQVEYPLPTSLLRLKRIEFKYDSTGQYVLGKNFSEQQVRAALGDNILLGASTADPYYRLGDTSLFVYPQFTAVVTGGIRVEYNKDVVDLSSGTDIPDMLSVVHQILSVGAAYDFALAKEMRLKAEELRRLIFGIPGFPDVSLKADLELIYAKRDDTTKTGFRVRRERFD